MFSIVRERWWVVRVGVGVDERKDGECVVHIYIYSVVEGGVRIP